MRENVQIIDSREENTPKEEVKLTKGEKVGGIVILSLVILIAVGFGNFVDMSIREDAIDNTKTDICVSSGFDGYERIREVDYCYVGKGLDTVLVPLIISLPESGEE